MTDHLKGFFESAAYLRKQDRQWLDDFDKQTIAAYNHIRKLEARLICAVCGGSPNPSGIKCICGDTGSLVEAEFNARSELLRHQAFRDEVMGLQGEPVPMLSKWIVNGQRMEPPRAVSITEIQSIYAKHFPKEQSGHE